MLDVMFSQFDSRSIHKSVFKNHSNDLFYRYILLYYNYVIPISTINYYNAYILFIQFLIFICENIYTMIFNCTVLFLVVVVTAQEDTKHAIFKGF